MKDIDDVKKWSAAEIEVLTPAEWREAQVAAGVRPSWAIAFRKKGDAAPALQLAARNGFRGISGPWLNKLMTQ